MFSNILMFALLYALHDHRTPLYGIIGALVLEVGLDLWWIPHFGIAGAAWSRLAAEFVNGSVLGWGVWRHIFSSPRTWNAGRLATSRGIAG